MTYAVVSCHACTLVVIISKTPHKDGSFMKQEEYPVTVGLRKQDRTKAAILKTAIAVDSDCVQTQPHPCGENTLLGTTRL